MGSGLAGVRRGEGDATDRKGLRGSDVRYVGQSVAPLPRCTAVPPLHVMSSRVGRLGWRYRYRILSLVSPLKVAVARSPPQASELRRYPRQPRPTHPTSRSLSSRAGGTLVPSSQHLYSVPYCALALCRLGLLHVVRKQDPYQALQSGGTPPSTPSGLDSRSTGRPRVIAASAQVRSPRPHTAQTLGVCPSETALT